MTKKNAITKPVKLAIMNAAAAVVGVGIAYLAKAGSGEFSKAKLAGNVAAATAIGAAAGYTLGRFLYRDRVEEPETPVTDDALDASQFQ